MRNRVIDHSAGFSELEGATLEWQHMTVSHSAFVFLATGLPRGLCKLRFAKVVDIDCPAVMHNIRLRMATDQENRELLARLTKRQFQYTAPNRKESGCSPDEGRVIIECEEGTYSLWAFHLTLCWEGTADFDKPHILDAAGPLWNGGSPLAEL